MIEGVIVTLVSLFAAGYLTGYAVKKALDFIMGIFGLFMIGVGVFVGLGVLSVNWDRLNQLFMYLVEWVWGTASEHLAGLTLSIWSISFIAGLFLGIVKPPGTFTPKSIVYDGEWVEPAD